MSELTPDDIRTCTTCGETKLIGAFHRNRSRPSGRHDKCKACMQEYNTARRARLSADDPGWEDRERVKNREYQQKWRRDNRDRSNAYSRVYYDRNRERISEKNRIAAAKRRADLRAARRDEREKE